MGRRINPSWGGPIFTTVHFFVIGARYSSVVRAFAHGAMGRRINPSRRGPIFTTVHFFVIGARYSSVVRAFAHGAMGRQVHPSWGGHIGLFLIPASDSRLV